MRASGVAAPAEQPAAVNAARIGAATGGAYTARHSAGPNDHISAFGLHSAVRRLSNQARPKSTANAIWAGETFGRLVAQSGFHGASGVYAFSGEALELLTAAKRQGLWTAVEQMIAPRTIVDQLACEEEVLNPGWQLPVANDVHADVFAAREQAEWQIADAVVCPSDFVARHVIEAGCMPEKLSWCPMVWMPVSRRMRVRVCRDRCGC